jgi:peptidoglycan/LPS O-acetylase OafA/YrhL
MFGCLRLLLALAVVVGHVVGPFWIGAYAVFGFYGLSGYLMTMVLHSQYGYSPAGVARYASNRFLRIYPPYWFAACLGVVVVHQAAACAVALVPNFMIPASSVEALKNLLLIGLDPAEPQLLVPPAWALSVELIFYLLMGLGLSRNRRVAAAWLGISVLVHAAILVHGHLWWGMRYYRWYSASLPFSLGANLFLWRERIPKFSPSVFSALVAGALLNAAIAGYREPFGVHMYVNLAFSMAIIASLSRVRAAKHLARLDKSAGDLSYTVYLLHFAVAALMAKATGLHGWSLLAVTLGPLLVLGKICNLLIEEPIERLRRRLRPRRAGAPSVGMAPGG